MLKLNQNEEKRRDVKKGVQGGTAPLNSTRVIVHSTEDVVGRYRLPEVSRN